MISLILLCLPLGHLEMQPDDFTGLPPLPFHLHKAIEKNRSSLKAQGEGPHCSFHSLQLRNRTVFDRMSQKPSHYVPNGEKISSA